MKNATYSVSISITRTAPLIKGKYDAVEQEASYTQLVSLELSAASLEKLQTIIKAHVDLVEE